MEAVPKVSAVVITYNRARLIGACLESITRQTYRDFEIVVIDDGSIDDTAAVVAACAPQALYFWQENQGIPGARNRGVRESRGAYLWIVDSDDTVLEDALATEVPVLDEKPNVGLVYGQAWQVNERGEVTGLIKPAFARSAYVRSGLEEIRDLIFSNHITPSTILVRKRCIEDVGPFDPEFFPISEDLDMWIRIAKKYSIAYIDRPLANYAVHSGPTGNIYGRTDPRTLERLRRLQLERVFEDPEVRELYQDLKGKALSRHHYVVAARAYKAREMGLARSHALRAIRARPLEILGRRGLAMAALLLRTLVPVTVLKATKGILRAVRGYVPGRRLGTRTASEEKDS